MPPRLPRIFLVAGLLAALGGAAGSVALATPQAERATMRGARDAAADQQAIARKRAEEFERRKSAAEAAADRAATEAAAMAAQVQQAERAIDASRSETAAIDRRARAVRARLERRRAPLLKLTAALQTMARRPFTLSLLQPGSLEDIVHTRAILASAGPEIQMRTEGLREEIQQVERLGAQRARSLAALREAREALTSRRRDLAALVERNRIAARRAGGDAVRESTRALALAEEARDLDDLLGAFDADSALRTRLAALPGPVLRPADPQRYESRSPISAPTSGTAISSARFRIQLPAAGRVVTGFGEAGAGDARSTGITIAPAGGALVVSPAAGRIAFAGAYRGYDEIVIVEHANGWTSLVTGLGRSDVAVGQSVQAGFPLGRAAQDQPRVGYELRRDNRAVNPVAYVR